MSHKIVASGVVILAIAAIPSGCSSDNSPAGSPETYAGSCDQLASRCHGSSDPLAKECHDLGHEGDDAMCGPRRGECLAACPEKAPSTGSDAGRDAGEVIDASADAGPAAECVAYCSCMQTSCSSMTNYPFEDQSICYAACATFSAAERSCFHVFCTDAAESGSDHACDHATGKLGLAECP